MVQQGALQLPTPSTDNLKLDRRPAREISGSPDFRRSDISHQRKPIRKAILKAKVWLGRQLTGSQKAAISRLRHGQHDWQHRLINRIRGNTHKGARAHVVTSGFDTRKAAEDNLFALQALLDSDSLEYAILPTVDVYRPKVVVAYQDVASLINTLNKLSPADGWTYRLHRGLLPVDEFRLDSPITEEPDPITAITLTRTISSPSGQILSTEYEDIDIQIWAPLNSGTFRVDGGKHTAGTLHAMETHAKSEVAYLTPSQWRAIQQRKSRRLELGNPLLMEVTEPIDMVYTWVDDSDPAWLERKMTAAGDFDMASVNPESMNSSRYLNRDELRYSLRSVETYANWVRHIYIVTDQQVPSWLNIHHPKITIIDHRDIFRDPSVLPVFNSHAIESQLHHIPGLSEHYIYMNDDLFFTRPVNPDLFVTSNGIAKFFLSKATLDISSGSVNDVPVLSAAKNGRDFISNIHDRAVTRKFKHTPHVQTKSVLESLENEQPEIFKTVAASKFRHPEDYSIPSALQHYHAYMLGKSIPGDIRYEYIDISHPDSELRLVRAERRSLQVICLNDTDVDFDDEERVNNVIGRYLRLKFPIPSSFEIEGSNPSY